MRHACPVHVLAIVGMGGLGKTTLAQLVYNDRRVRQSFEVFAWVCVSEQFDVSTITKNIITSVTKARCDLSEFADLQEKLVLEVQDKRVLLVLDDVWNERSDLWEFLCMPISKTRICNIIVTTRNEAVAKMVQTMKFYPIKCLDCDESWSLFKQGSLAIHQDNDTSKNLVEIGKNIVKKCKGLPLAIKALGSILRCETNELRWRDVLESELWDLEESRSEVLAALELSYKHMPIYLKRCFVALSLFPKDYNLQEWNVVKLWKSLDLLQCDRNEKEDDIGRKYFNGLVHRSMLEAYEEGSYIYVMHDLIHDLACSLGEEEFFRIEGDTSIEIPLTVRYISASQHGASPENLSASHSIRAILFLDKSNDLRFLSKEYCLQKMLLLNCKKLRVITHIGRILGVIVLPSRIGSAINLHTLPAMEIRSCDCVCNISVLRSLNKIRELSLNGLGDVARVEDAEGTQLQSKKHLRSLALRFGHDGYFCENMLQGEKNTSRLDSVADIEDAKGAHLQKKKYLWSLALALELDFVGKTGPCCDCEDTLQGEAVLTVSHEQLLESLRPHHVLRKLEIQNYKSQRYPSWLGNASYSNLTEVFLLWCDSPHLPTLGELPSLKSLQMISMDLVENIGREFCSHIPGVKGFPSLTHLVFNSFIVLSEWSEVNVGEFPCLQTLKIRWVQKLRSLPSVLFMSLVTLHLENCENLTTFPESDTLRKLAILYCGSLSQLPTLVSLQELDIAGCPSLQQLPTLVSLWKLYISDCKSFQELPTLVALRELRISECGSFRQLPTLVALRELRILWCPKLSAVGSLPSLTTLDIWTITCPFDDEEILYKLLNCNPSLECISVTCHTTRCIPLQPQSLPLLTKLHLYCPKLLYCNGLAGLTSLQELDVTGCPKLPIFSNLHNVKIIRTC